MPSWHMVPANAARTPGLRVKSLVCCVLQCFYYTYRIFCSYRSIHCGKQGFNIVSPSFLSIPYPVCLLHWRFAFNRWQDCPKKLSSDFWPGICTESRAASEVILSILLPFGSVFLPSALLTTENHKIKISVNSENCWTLCALRCQIFSATI